MIHFRRKDEVSLVFERVLANQHVVEFRENLRVYMLTKYYKKQQTELEQSAAQELKDKIKIANKILKQEIMI